MAGDELEIVRLRNDFYRDGFIKVLIAFAMIVVALVLLGAISVYLFLEKPDPVAFATDNDWRAFPPVPLDKTYKTTPELLQWVSNVLPQLFTFDFVNYPSEINNIKPYFTANGWTKIQPLINTYASINVIQSAKLFLNTNASGAPFIINQGILGGKYGWWVQMPLKINYSSSDRRYDRDVILQVLVIRVSTLDNLAGVAIDNVIETKQTKSQNQSGQAGPAPQGQAAPGQPIQGPRFIAPNLGPVEQPQGGNVGTNG